MKAWFVRHKDGDYGEIVQAETRGKAILMAEQYDAYYYGSDYINYRARRVPGADDVEDIRPQTYLANGFGLPCCWCEHTIWPDEPYNIISNGYDVCCEACDR